MLVCEVSVCIGTETDLSGKVRGFGYKIGYRKWKMIDLEDIDQRRGA